MKNLKAKLKKQGGFTLVEMLIVVAIIGILIAVSIPSIKNALESTQHATDAANERAAKAVAMIAFLNGDFKSSGTEDTDLIYSTDVYYDAKKGELTAVEPTDSKDFYGKHNKHQYIVLHVEPDGTIQEGLLKWKQSDGNWDIKLCSEVGVNGH